MNYKQKKSVRHSGLSRISFVGRFMTKRFWTRSFVACQDHGRKVKYLLFLFGLLLPAQFGKHFWPSWSYVIGIRIDYLSPTIYVTDILAVLIIGAWIIQAIINKNDYMRHSGLSRISFPYQQTERFCPACRHAGTSQNDDSKLSKLFFPIFLLFLGIGIFLSQNPFAGWYEFLKLIEFVSLGLALRFYFSKYLSWFLWGLSCSVLYESILTIWQFFLQSSAGGLWYFLGERTFSSQTPGIANMSLGGELMLRPYGTFSHPNVLGAYLLISLIFITQLRVKGKELRVKDDAKELYPIPYTLYPIFGLGSFALFLTFSRSVIFLWCIFLGVWVCQFVRHSGLSRISFAGRFTPKRFWTRSFVVCQDDERLKTKLGLVIFFLIIFLILVISPIRERFFFNIFFDESITTRIELIKASLLMIKTNPLLGLGLANFFSALPEFSSILFRTNFIQPVHNIFLLAASETGAPGLFFFLWFLWKTFRNIKCQISNVKYQMLLTFIFLGNVDHYFLTLQQGQLLSVVIFAICWAG